MLIFPLFLLGISLIFVFYVIFVYNGIISLRNTRENAFADIDVQLKLRFDLIPNLINTVKGYTSHEKETLTAIVESRNKYATANSVDDKILASNMLTDGLNKLFALSENYPDLKANTNFLELQRELSDVENKIASSRRFFNSSTNEYNTYIEMFPGNLVSSFFGFKRYSSFELENRELEKQVPKVEF